MNGTIESQNQRPVQDARGDLIILPQRGVVLLKEVVKMIYNYLENLIELEENESEGVCIY